MFDANSVDIGISALSQKQTSISAGHGAHPGGVGCTYTPLWIAIRISRTAFSSSAEDPVRRRGTSAGSISVNRA